MWWQGSSPCSHSFSSCSDIGIPSCVEQTGGPIHLLSMPVWSHWSKVMVCFFLWVHCFVGVWVGEVFFGDVGACSVSVVLCLVVFDVFGCADDAAYFPGVVGVCWVVFVAL